MLTAGADGTLCHIYGTDSFGCTPVAASTKYLRKIMEWLFQAAGAINARNPSAALIAASEMVPSKRQSCQYTGKPRRLDMAAKRLQQTVRQITGEETQLPDGRWRQIMSLSPANQQSRGRRRRTCCHLPDHSPILTRAIFDAVIKLV
jgi:hypothetical protein